MTIDNTKAIFSSLWDIDQLLITDTAPVPVGTTDIYTLPSGTDLSTHEVQFQPTGSTKWYDVGMSSTDNTLANVFTFYTYVSGGTLNVVTSIAGTVRFFAWEDKLNYG